MQTVKKANSKAGRKLRFLCHWFYRQDRQLEVKVLYEVSVSGGCKLFTINKIIER